MVIGEGRWNYQKWTCARCEKSASVVDVVVVKWGN